MDAWRLLGTVHAENDDDTQAIAAMGQALKADPKNPEVCFNWAHVARLVQSVLYLYADVVNCALSMSKWKTLLLPSHLVTAPGYT